jgi:hypothetical protein
VGPRLLPEQDIYGACTLERVRQVIIYGTKYKVERLWRLYPRACAPDERLWHTVVSKIDQMP